MSLIFGTEDIRKCPECGMLFNLDKDSRKNDWHDDFCSSMCEEAYFQDNQNLESFQKIRRKKKV